MKLARLALLASVSLVACSGQDDPLVPDTEEQARLDRQVERVFANVEMQDAVAWERDRSAVAQAHLFAYWIRNYHELHGSYPLADRLDEDTGWVQTVVFGNDSSMDYSKSVNVPPEDLLEALRTILGPGVTLPQDPDPSDSHGLHYTTNGMGFMVAADLTHPVNGGEMITDDHGQYRVASYEGSSIPIQSIAKILGDEDFTLSPATRRGAH